MAVASLVLFSLNAFAKKPPPDSKPDLEQRMLELESLVATLQSALAANTAADAAAHHTKYTDADAIAAAGPHFSGKHDDLTNVTANQHHVPAVTDLTGIENAIAYYDDLLTGVTRFDDDPTTDNTDTIRFSGMNLQIVNGMDFTQTFDGTGNLIIGYNEMAGGERGNDRSGSHMLVIGEGNNYSGYGGMVVGEYNTVVGQFSSVTGGIGNTAGGRNTFVTGGSGNTAVEDITSVFGGDAELSAFRQDLTVVNDFITDYSQYLGSPYLVKRELGELKGFVSDFNGKLGSPSTVVALFCTLDPLGVLTSLGLLICD